jgi:hypothetical protein
VIGLYLHCADLQARAVGQCPIRVIRRSKHSSAEYSLFGLDVDV